MTTPWALAERVRRIPRRRAHRPQVPLGAALARDERQRLPHPGAWWPRVWWPEVFSPETPSASCRTRRMRVDASGLRRLGRRASSPPRLRDLLGRAGPVDPHRRRRQAHRRERGHGLHGRRADLHRARAREPAACCASSARTSWGSSKRSRRGCRRARPAQRGPDLTVLATIVYTSGTTGRPKGVELTATRAPVRQRLPTYPRFWADEVRFLLFPPWPTYSAGL